MGKVTGSNPVRPTKNDSVLSGFERRSVVESSGETARRWPTRGARRRDERQGRILSDPQKRRAPTGLFFYPKNLYHKKMRLDKHLIIKYPNLSRVYIKDQIKLGNFLVGGKKVKPSHMLSEDDQVALAPDFSLPEKAVIIPNPEIKLNIIFENDDVIVINKPAGLSVHPRQDKNGLPLLSETNSTLISGLLAHYPPLTEIGDIPAIRPGIVHRLDKDTSGIMIVAKNQNSFDWLKKQFKDRQTIKKYLALAAGRLEEKEGQIKTLLQRASSDPTRQKVQPWTKSPQFSHQPEEYQAQVQGGTPHRRPLASEHEEWPSGAGVSTKEGKEAITNYKVIKEFKNYSLLEVSPKTGRLHQIRVHLAYLGHSVAGDAKYGDKRLPILPGLDRQFLHATELTLILPDGEKHVFSSPLPEDLAAILNPLVPLKIIK